MEKVGFVYIMTNNLRTTLYIGVTSQLRARIYKHKTGFYQNSFSSKYNLFNLVYYQKFSTIIAAIAFEKKLKSGSREKKLSLIQSINPDWRDLYDDL